MTEVPPASVELPYQHGHGQVNGGASQVGPWGVTWTSSDRRARDIGGAIGYATRAEAEAVGQDYVSNHGGAYQAHGS